MFRIQAPLAVLTVLVIAILTCSANATNTRIPIIEVAAASTIQPTVELPPTTTVAPINTRTPTPTPTATTILPTGILFNDDFSSRQVSEGNGWDFASTENVERIWSANKYTLSVKKKNYLGYSTPDGEYNDFGAEIEAQANSAYAKYGIRFRSQGGSDNPSYYIFVVTTDGKYYVDKLLNDEWADISPVPVTASQYINKGKAKNTLGVLAEGSTISLYINRHLVKTFTDDSIDSGQVGVLAGPGDNDSAQVTFSRLTILTADKVKADWGVAPITGTTQPTATPTKTGGGGSGNGVITVRNTFDGACQVNLSGTKEVVIRAEGNSTRSMSLPPGVYGAHVAVDIGDVDLDQFTVPPGDYCEITCDAMAKSVYNSCSQRIPITTPTVTVTPSGTLTATILTPTPTQTPCPTELYDCHCQQVCVGSNCGKICDRCGREMCTSKTPTDTPTPTPAASVIPPATLTSTGRLEITYPLTMTVDEDDIVTVEIMVDPALTQVGIYPAHVTGVITIEISTQDSRRATIEDRVTLYPVMSAELIATNFEIKQGDANPQRAIVAGERSAAWTWTITAKKPGLHRITINIFGHTTTNGKEFMALETSKTRNVTVLDKPLHTRILDSLLNNLPAVIGTGGPLGLVILFLTYRMNRETKKLKDTIESLQKKVAEFEKQAATKPQEKGKSSKK